MNALDLIERLESLGIRIAIHEGRLRVNAPKGVLGDALKAELARNKEAILAHLRTREEADARASGERRPARVDRSGDLPLSHTQQRLWFLKQMDPGNMAYQLPCAFRMEGVLDETALERSLADLVQRHESLRTRFIAVDGTPRCVIEPIVTLPFERVDLGALPLAEREGATTEALRQFIFRPFDIARAPLMRATLIRLAPRTHVFCFVQDHIVSDGISVGILLLELRALYTQHVGGPAANLAPLPVQYVDIADWQRHAFEAGALTRHLDYWKRQLADLLPALQLPTDRPRPPVQTYRGARLIRNFPNTLAAQARAMARSEGATQFMVLLAAFQVLLHRYCGVADIPVGTAVGNRGHASAEAVVGFFANNIVLRGDLSGRPTVGELLARVRETCLQGMSHQEMPFDLLVDALSTRREIDHAPLFQVMFVLHNVSMQRLELPQLECDVIELGSDAARFDLSVDMFDMADGMRVSFEYNTDLFDEATIDRMVGHYRRLLEGFVAQPEARIGALPLLSESEQRQLLLEWNATAMPFSTEQTVHCLFEARVAHTPDAVAARFEGAQLSYRELNARANQLAHHLRALGVGRESLVGVWMERSVEMIVALLGILKAGGAYVPLDPAFPKDRIDFMMEDAALGVVVTQTRLAETLGAGGPHPVRMDGDSVALAKLPAGNLAPLADARNLAYVIYTSGSTGRPKGVQIEHRSVVNFLLSMHLEPGIGAQDRFVAVTTLSFDIAGLEILGPLTVGGTVVLASRATALDGVRLAELLDHSDATILQATPATWRLLLETGWRGRPKLKMLCGGEALPRDLAGKLLALGGELWNMYGPTETTIWSTLSRVTDTSRAIPIGRPIANTQVYVLEPSGLPAPIGVGGELCIGGDGLARGYRNRDDLTADKFVMVDLPAVGPTRVYRTGDVARFLADGQLEFVGRRDHQVKVRGFRIELGEIETVLATHAGVKECVVHVREDTPGDQRLVGYVVPAAGESFDVDAARATLRAKLPEYMVPNSFVTLEALPLTLNGKIDRNALPRPDGESATDKPRPLVEPRTATERQLAAIWSDVLKVAAIGIDDNFFASGGHSLLVARVAARIRTKFDIEVPVRVLFELQTIRQLAAHMNSLGRRAGKAVAIPVAQRPPRPPLSFAQQRLWFFQQMEPGSTLFNLPVVLRLRGAVDLSSLEACLGLMLDRHESLRTIFPLEADEPYQRVTAEISSVIPVTDLSGCETAEQDIALSTSIRTQSSAPFDLVKGPLVRTCLIRLANEDHVFIVTFHHAISDAASSAIFINELAECYRARSTGQAPRLSPLPIQYVDFAIWQRDWLSGSRLNEQIDYWRRHLEGAPAFLDLPLDRPRRAVQTYSGAAYQRRLDPALQARLVALSRRENATLFMTLFSALVHLLGRQSGQDDVCLGVAVAGRGAAETENLIGLFINTLALRTRLRREMSYEELLRIVRESALGAYAHQELPFERLVEELQPPRDLSRTPLFQVLFNMLDFGMPASLQLPGLEFAPFSEEPALDLQAKFDLTLYVQNHADGLGLTAVYNTDLFSADRIGDLVDQYVNLLTTASDVPARPMCEWSLVTAKSSRILPDPKAPLNFVWNGTAQSRLAQHATAAPARLAVQDCAGSMTYGELEEVSNRIAQYLIELGVHREDRVAVHADRHAGLVAAMLGIMKAGAAFVLLDSAYPAKSIAERIGIAEPKAWIDLTGRPLPEPVESALNALPARARLGWDAAASASELAWKHCVASAPSVVVAPDDLAYLVFTSGSTGVPKAIAGTHAPLSHFFQWHQDTWNLGPDDRFSVLSGLSHDPLLRDVLGALWAGSAIVMPDATRMGTPGYLADWLRRERVTVAHLTPAMADMLVIGQESGSGVVLPELRHAFFGGDVLTIGTVRALRRMAPRAETVNCYGTSETPQVIAVQRVLADAGASPAQRVPLGRGISDVQLLVLNESEGLAGIGELGEICVRTPYLARGYFGDRSLTEARFVANPATGDPLDRIYRTGDLGRFRPDGCVEFQGRRDGQVKIRGYRVELGAIEHALRTLPAVGDAAVIARCDVAGTNVLVGYAVPRRGETVDASDVRGRLAASLPDYMIPGAFVVLPALPLTPNGKLDREALPEPTATGHVTAVVSPRTVLETKLHAIWEQVLGRTGVSMHDNFFELGGHSLLAVRVFSQIERVIGAKLPISVLFQAPTLAQLARRLEHEEFQSPWSSLVAIQPYGRKPPLFLVPGLGGNVVCYFAMARLLGDDQPLYALQSRGLDGEETPFDRVGPMAAHYLSEIRQVQPTGPYFLGGACFGGIVAYEMAQQLRAAGKKVSLVLLLETFPIPRRRLLKRLMLRTTRVFSHLRFLAESTARHLRQLRTLSPMHLPKALLQRLKIVREIVEQRDVYRGDRVALYAERVSTANFAAMLAYSPKPYGGRLAAVLATERRLSGPDTRYLWRKLAPNGYSQFEMPVTDSGELLISPYVETLVPWVRDSLETARRDTGHTAADERFAQGAVALNPR